MEIEFINADIPFLREAELVVCYKEKILSHKFLEEFYCFEKIIVEIKSCDEGITDNHIAQTLNYLRVSDCEMGLIVNFGKENLNIKDWYYQPYNEVKCISYLRSSESICS
ncbi:MAG: GxxExxY protein [Chitinophagaceae bacterium]|nr:GxxExxY protein [Chitinophagaceae bacterium]